MLGGPRRWPAFTVAEALEALRAAPADGAGPVGPVTVLLTNKPRAHSWPTTTLARGLTMGTNGVTGIKLN